jgi:tetratricopeptide (TPR) repeat protein
VTLEEGLVAVLAAVAGILLFIGLAQALEPPRPARRRRTSPPADAPQSPAAPVKSPVVMELPPRAPYTGPERRRSPRPGSRPRARIVPPAPAAVTLEQELPDQAPLEFVAPAPAPVDRPPLLSLAAEPAPAVSLDPAVEAVERALARQREGQHAEAMEAALSHLESAAHLDSGEGPEADQPGFARAALWVLVGVSRHALGDVEGTQEALESAVRAAPDGVSEGCPERITALAAPAAQELLAAADRMSPASAERVPLLRMAVLWLEWRIVAAPATVEVSELLDKARETLWEGYALAGRGLLQRRQFAHARRLVREALDSEDLPATRRAPLLALAAQGVVRQIGRLVATARGRETPEPDALDALERAREILVATSVESIAPRRWHAANRRIWNGYMRLARRQIEGFELEDAVRPLLRALLIRDLDLGLERRTRELLARTIERIADRAGESIGRLLKAGDRDAAMQRWQDVRGLIQKARDQGLSHEELAQAFSRARQMLEQIESVKR